MNSAPKVFPVAYPTGDNEYGSRIQQIIRKMIGKATLKSFTNEVAEHCQTSILGEDHGYARESGQSDEESDYSREIITANMLQRTSMIFILRFVLPTIYG